MNIIVLLTICFVHQLLAGDDQLKVGQDALQKGDYLTAITALREAVKNDKKNPQAYILLASALIKADSADAAVAPLFQASALDPNNATIYLLLGDAYAKQKIFAAAAEQYKKATELDSNNFNAFFKLAEGYRKARQYPLAIQAYRNVLRLDSNNVGAIHELSSLYFRGKQYANASPLLEKLVQAQPESLAYKIQYVKALSETNKDSALIPIAEEIVKKDPSQVEIQTILANAYNKTKQTEKVIKTYEALNPQSLSVDDLIRYALALRSLDSLKKAEEIFGIAYTKDSARCDIPYHFGTLLMKLKKWPEAIRMFERKLVCDTSAGYQFASHLNLAMCLMQMKKFTEAREHIQKSIDLRPDNIQAWLSMAQDLGQLEKTTEEIAAYKKVIEIGNAANANGDEGKYTAQLGEAYRMVGVRLLIDATKDKPPKKEKYQAAVDYLKKALLYNPKDCSLLLWTAQASQNTNNKDEAKKYYCKVLENCSKAKEADDAKKGLETLGMKCGE
jgi:tetratricopeptide (TPR) repeat protein